MKMSRALSTLGLVILGSAGCARAPAGAGLSGAGYGAPALTGGDQEFVTKASQDSLLEIELGREAAKRGSTLEVKAFGEQMMKDHGKANDELIQLARSKNMGLAPNLDERGQAKVADIKSLPQDKFDERYAKNMRADHEADVKEVRKAAMAANDPDVRAWAARTLPVLEHHLEHVRTLEAKVSR